MTSDDQSEPTGPVGRTDPLDQLGSISTAPVQRPRRTRTTRPSGTAPAGYIQAWALFADWCAATDHQALPADPATVVIFLAACPAATATQRRRVAAIDYHHTTASQPAPGDEDEIRAAVGRPPRERVWVCPDRAAVDTALRALPSHGFTAGLFGQRDRALLVLSQIAGLPYSVMAALTASDLQHDKIIGTVTIATSGRMRSVEPDDDAVLCPACALTRWVRTHAVMTRHIATQPLIAHLRAVEPVIDTAPHDCRQPTPVASAPVPLLTRVNQWGHIPFPQTQLSAHAVSQHARALLAGRVRPHRDVPAGAAGEPAAPATVENTPRLRPYGPAERDAAWNQRRADLRRLAGVAAELDQRLIELLTRWPSNG